MKRIILFLVILFTFIFVPVNAKEITVCDDCAFSSIDAALFSLEKAPLDDNEKVIIFVDTLEEQTLSDHIIYNTTTINFRSAGTLNGNGANIVLNSKLIILGNIIEFRDTNFNVPKAILYDMDDVSPGAVVLQADNLHVDNVNIIGAGRKTCYEFDLGIDILADNVSIDNSNISGFIFAIESFGQNSSVNNCDLSNNDISLVAINSGFVKDSILSSIVSLGNFVIDETNDIEDMKIKRMVINDLSPCTLKDNPGIYVDPSSEFINVSLIKKIKVDFNETKEIKNFLKLFREENGIDGFSFSIDDDSIVSISEGNIKLLKPGEVNIVAKNENTKETYYFKINIIKSSISNNPKTNNPIFYMGLIGFIVLMISYAFYNYNNKID